MDETKDTELNKVQEDNNDKKSNPVLDFFWKTLNGMAYGLFSTLIIGTIFGTIGTLFHYGNNPFCDFMFSILNDKSGLAFILQVLTGAGIGVGIALALKFDPLKTVMLGAVGEVAALFSLSTKFITNSSEFNFFSISGFKIGDPLTIYLVCIAVTLAIKYVLVKKTPVDILIVPLFGLAVGLTSALLIRYPAIYVTYGIQWLVNSGTTAVPFIMGIVVAVLMGMALTAPISTAAIAAMIFVIPLGADPSLYQGLMIASGAAVIGCSTQMVGFAIQSRKDNPIGMVISIGIGTSMLQFKNILKNPLIWLPTIITSAVLGPISTCLIKVQCMGSSAGMGTAGLVGQIGTISSMGVDNWQVWVDIFVIQIIAPAAMVFGLDLLFRKLDWIKDAI